MRSPYIAKGPHKRPCDLCGTPILPGDSVDTWAWMGAEIGHGNIMRVHSSCKRLNDELGIEEWHLGKAFKDDDEAKARAAAMLAESRKPLSTLGGEGVGK